MKECDLTDAALVRKWATPRYTGWCGASQARLDRFYVSGDLLSRVLDYAVTPVPLYDHGLVTCEISHDANKKQGKLNPCWIMNAAVIQNTEFVECVQGEI